MSFLQDECESLKTADFYRRFLNARAASQGKSCEKQLGRQFEVRPQSPAMIYVSSYYGIENNIIGFVIVIFSIIFLIFH